MTAEAFSVIYSIALIFHLIINIMWYDPEEDGW